MIERSIERGSSFSEGIWLIVLAGKEASMEGASVVRGSSRADGPAVLEDGQRCLRMASGA
jgi:hypothetical protein